MQDLFIEYLVLVALIVAFVMLANKLRVAYPIVLVLGGLLLSFVNIFTHIEIDPDLIFFIFLPPLLYDAAWQVAWKDLWKWRRVIISFAFPIVILTSTVVAFSSQMLIPGFTLALGFLLGGIVSPPDAISATTIMRKVSAPRVLVSVSEGESLLNDASALIVFRFALAAVLTGEFHLSQAVGSFFMVIIMGTAIGLIIGLFFYAIYRWLPMTPSIEIILSFIAPYCMYYFAEKFHFSGVLAVVAGGLMLSSKRESFLSLQGRTQGASVWGVIGFMLNGVVFMLIGLQLPLIVSQVEEVSLSQAIIYGVIISLVLIVTRIACTLGASIFTRFMGHFITVADRNPGWRMPFAFGWAGMRGVVSLAAALSIPVLASNGQAFPFRNLILIITFVVIVVTLVFQGLTLPWVIRKLGIVNVTEGGPLAHELPIRKAMHEVSIKFIEQNHSEALGSNDHLHDLYRKLSTDLSVLGVDLETFNREGRGRMRQFQEIYSRVLDEQRKVLHDLNHNEMYEEEVIRKYLALVDLEEAKLRQLTVDE